MNRIRELPQNSNVVATHTDSPDVALSFPSIFYMTSCIFFLGIIFKFGEQFIHLALFGLIRSSFGTLGVNLIV